MGRRSEATSPQSNLKVIEILYIDFKVNVTHATGGVRDMSCGESGQELVTALWPLWLPGRRTRARRREAADHQARSGAASGVQLQRAMRSH